MISAQLSSLILGLLLALGVTAWGGAMEGRATFPGREAECAGPGDQYVVVNVDPEAERDPEAPHQLWLQDRLHAQKFKLLEYGRSVEVLWSPHGKALAVTDHAGSDRSNTYIFLLGTEIRRIDVGAEFQHNAGATAAVLDNHHAYLEATQWVDDMRILVHLHGYGDESPEGFEFTLEYAVGNGFHAEHGSAGRTGP